MIITCPRCSTRYDIEEASLGGEGRSVRCADCEASWFVPA
ncbi:MAG: zinc-ribbon domain-containing protein, partial [Pseudomonadota bacterium]